MHDLLAQLGVASEHGPWAAVLMTALLGLTSSLGPCNGPRLLALSAFVVRARRPLRVGAAFIGGHFAAYAALGIAGIALLNRLSSVAGWLYGAIALAGIGGGCVLLSGARWADGCSASELPKRDLYGGAFAGGAAFALVIQPCCTPVLVAIVALAAIAWPLWTAVLMLFAFGLGHAAPVFLVAALGEGALKRLRRFRLQQATEIVSAASLLAVGAYYALLV